MSNPIKAIGKAFKSVVKVVKKIALPALAIAAVVLTGGAALGVLPALGGAGGLLASVGIHGALAGVLTSAASAATFGAVGAALTGGNIIKGATTGFITGGILGGANAALGAAKGLGTAAQAAGTGSNTASTAASFADKVASAPGLDVISNGSLANAGNAVASSSAGGLGGLGMAGKVGGLAASSGAGTALIDPVVSSVAPSASGGGIMGWLNKNPVMGGMVVQGLGQGIMANEQNKAAQRERDQIAANYGDTSGLPQYQSQGNGYSRAADVFNAAIYAGKKVTYDPKTGLKVSN